MSDSDPLPANISAQPPISRAVILAVLAASLMVGTFAISTQSYWIDEATSLIVAMSPNLADAWKYAQAVGGSTIQMPLYHVYLYAWHKAFGSGEWAMRASNLPWLFLAQLAFLVILRDKPRLALLAALLAIVSPTVWMYLDEARPYLVQYAAACWFIAAIVRATTSSPAPAASAEHQPTFLLPALGIAAVILFGSSLLGVVWVAGFFCALLWLYLTPPPGVATSAAKANRRSLLLSVTFLAVIALLVVYYIWTWSAAGRGYHRAGASLVSLPYIAYEFLGFAGYGPGKLQLRSSIAGSLAQALPALLPLAVIIAALALFLLLQPGVRSIPRRTLVAWTLALVLPSLLILTVLFVASYRPLPRHFIPALPAVILALAALIDSALAQKNLIWRIVAILKSTPKTITAQPPPSPPPLFATTKKSGGPPMPQPPTSILPPLPCRRFPAEHGPCRHRRGTTSVSNSPRASLWSASPTSTTPKVRWHATLQKTASSPPSNSTPSPSSPAKAKNSPPSPPEVTHGGSR